MSVELIPSSGLIGAELVLERLPAIVEGSPEHPVEHHSAGGYQCLIGRVDNELVVWDLGSGNGSGTYVNGTRVTQANLKAGDRLALGVTEFTVRYKDRPRRYLHGVRN